MNISEQILPRRNFSEEETFEAQKKKRLDLSKLDEKKVTQEEVLSQERCAICLIDFDDPDREQSTDDHSRISKLKCSHILHYECIKKWLEDSDRNECPVCRGQAI